MITLCEHMAEQKQMMKDLIVVNWQMKSQSKSGSHKLTIFQEKTPIYGVYTRQKEGM